LQGENVVRLVDFTKDSEWSREAAAQGTIIVRALYSNQEDFVRTMLNPGSVVLLWQYNGGYLTPWPPSYCVCYTGPGQYFVYWAGTTSIAQGVGHIYGSVILPNFAGLFSRKRLGYAQTNFPWLSVMSEQMEELMAPLQPIPKGSTWHLFGHSYGGAIASLAGEYIAAETDGFSQVMTIGCPAVWSRGTLMGQPDVMYHLQSEFDLVTASPAPPDEVGYMLGIANDKFIDAAAALLLTDWGDHGQKILLSADGSGLPRQPYPVPFPEWVTNSFGGAHLTKNYMGRIIQSWKVQGG
jgi:pimeloyl-ACP methyl ester carboxylesterase